MDRCSVISSSTFWAWRRISCTPECLIEPTICSQLGRMTCSARFSLIYLPPSLSIVQPVFQRLGHAPFRRAAHLLRPHVTAVTGSHTPARCRPPLVAVAVSLPGHYAAPSG